jgi:predicted anti-sigma-YlaC factor YlaD
MDCRAFRQSHVAFVDDTLPGVDQQAMHDHLRRCAACAQLDARVRRSLMAARSLDPIVPSEGFSARLRSRLDVERRRSIVATPLTRGPSFVAFAAIAATVVGVGILAVEFQMAEESAADVPRLAGIVASVPAIPETLFASSSALAAAVSTSAPVWSLAYVADQMPIRFATAQLAEDLRDR